MDDKVLKKYLEKIFKYLAIKYDKTDKAYKYTDKKINLKKFVKNLMQESLQKLLKKNQNKGSNNNNDNASSSSEQSEDEIEKINKKVKPIDEKV